MNEIMLVFLFIWMKNNLYGNGIIIGDELLT